MIAHAQAAFTAIARQGPVALAWEVLRRDPAYRAAYWALPAVPQPGIAADAAFTTDWGIHFR